MKKLLVRVGIGVVLLAVIAIVVLAIFLDGIVKKGVETVGPSLTKTEVRLGGVHLSVVGGSAHLKKLFVGNPEGYKTPSAIEADSIKIDLKPSSVLSDKVIIRSIRIDAPLVNVEGSPSDNNLTKILANVQSSSGSSDSAAQPAGKEKKLQVDDLQISNTKLIVTLKLLGGRSATVSIPDVHLTNLGQGPEGISAAELTKTVMTALTSRTTQALLDLAKSMEGVVGDAVKDLSKGKLDGIDKAAKGVKDLFKKK